MDRAIAIETLQRFCRTHLTGVLFDAEAGRLLDVPTSMQVAFDAGRITSMDEAIDPLSGTMYLRLTLDDGAQVAVAAPGLVFSPSMKNSGPLDGVPNAVCLADARRLRAQVEHILDDHPETRIDATVLDMVRFAIAILDGARAVGFDVGMDEAALDVLLTRIEKRRG